MSSPGHQDLSSVIKPKTAAINSAAANITAIAAVPGRAIRVLAMHYSVSGAATLKFTDGSGGDELGRVTYGAAAVDEYGYANDGWFDCSPSTAFVIDNDDATTVAGTIRYVTIGAS